MDKKILAVAGMTLLMGRLVCAAPSQLSPVTIPAAHSASAAAVQQFLTARTAGQYVKAYGLLSTASQGMLPLSQFASTQNFPKDPTADGMTPLLSALSAFFVDAHDTSGYRYFVLGALPDSPDAVLVRARAPGAADVLLLKVVTVPGPTGGTPRLDLMQSMTRTDAKGMVWARQKAEQMASMSNLRQIGLGIMQYVQDHDETYPKADSWVDDIMPYLHNDESLFHDPSAPAGERWSYALNRNLSGKPLMQFDDPAETVSVFESTAGIKNASDTGESVPKPGRHQGGTDYAFADGHVKWLPDGTKVSYLLTGK